MVFAMTALDRSCGSARRFSSLVLLLALAACAPDSPEAGTDGAWVGTITGEGDVTTVINESGSVWGGAATLVEEASIGVDAGEEPYMLGRVRGIAAAGGRIYVLDSQVPALRVYDFEGQHLADIGGPGAGPGEFNEPESVAVAPDGRVFVRDARQGRINVYDEHGASIDTWAISSRSLFSSPMIVTNGGLLYAPIRLDSDLDFTERREGLQGFRPDGSLTEPIVEPELGYEQPEVIVRRDTRAGSAVALFPVPGTPSPVWILAPSGAMVTGIGDEYRYESRFTDGSAMIVRREFEPVPLQPDERDYHRRSFRANINRSARDDATIEGADPDSIPEFKPAFNRLLIGLQGSVWAVRSGPGEYFENCHGDPDDDPCWRGSQIVDVFDAEGRYLGEVEIPDGMQLGPRPHIDSDVVIARFEDEAGIPMVKRYRLTPPAGGGS